MLVTVGAAAYFLSARPTGADTGHAKPMIPSKIKEEVQKHDSAGNLKKTS
jgi:hypothetical protein